MRSPLIERLLRNALEEDIGSGDITTAATVPPGTVARAELVAKEDFVLAGIDVARQVFALIDAQVAFEELIADGQVVKRGEVIAWLKGDAASLLQGERVALNLLQRMSRITSYNVCYTKLLRRIPRPPE